MAGRAADYGERANLVMAARRAAVAARPPQAAADENYEPRRERPGGKREACEGAESLNIC